jgi:hypothetical protein
MRKIIGLVIFCTRMVYGSEYFVKEIVVPIYEFIDYFHRGHSGHPTPHAEIGKKHEILLETYYDSLMIKGSYSDAFSFIDIYINNRPCSHSPSGGFPQRVDMNDVVFNNVIKNIQEKIKNKTQKWFYDLLSQDVYDKAFKLASEYFVKDENLASRWLEEVKISSLNKIKKHAKKSVLLQSLDPNLAVEELALSRNIIDSFPDGSDIKNQLEAVLQTAIADVTASQPVQVSSDWLSSISQRL